MRNQIANCLRRQYIGISCHSKLNRSMLQYIYYKQTIKECEHQGIMNLLGDVGTNRRLDSLSTTPCHDMPCLPGPHVCETAIHIHDGTNINCCFPFPIVEISLCCTVNLNLYVRAIYSTYASIKPWCICSKFMAYACVVPICWD